MSGVHGSDGVSDVLGMGLYRIDDIPDLLALGAAEAPSISIKLEDMISVPT